MFLPLFEQDASIACKKSTSQIADMIISPNECILKKDGSRIDIISLILKKSTFHGQVLRNTLERKYLSA